MAGEAGVTGDDARRAGRAASPGVPGAPGAAAPAVAAALALVRGLLRAGVRDVVLAPGSRSAPLAYAVAAAAEESLLDLHVRYDERTAAFLAAGLARGTGLARPVAVVTTSGTAVANLHPAVLEAHHAGVPLVLLTADRPGELRGTGANQTTEQPGIFGGAVRFAADVPAPDGRPGELRDLGSILARALAAARGLRDGRPGPVHLNLAYREPLVPPAAPTRADLAPTRSDAQVTVPASGSAGAAAWRTDADAAVWWPAGGGAATWPMPDADGARRTVVVAGDGAGPAARALAEARGWPLLAEPSAGAAGGPNLICAPALVLGEPGLADAIERAIVLGRPTLSRPVQRLLGRPDVEVIVIAPGGGPWPDAARNAATVLPGIPAGWLDSGGGGSGVGPGKAEPSGVGPGEAEPSGVWLDRWRAAGRAAARAVAAATTGPPTGPGVARAVVGNLTGDDALVLGSSSIVRDVDTVLGLAVGEGRLGGATPTILANRGLAGIDGMVSTALGVALARSRAGLRTRALMGDLTFLHDIGGLSRGPFERPIDLTIVVVNDDGGSIFATLEPGAAAEASAGAARVFERVFATPHGADLGALCAGYGVAHRLVPDLAALRRALAEPDDGLRVVEMRVARSARRAESLGLAAAVRDVVARALGVA